MSIIKGFSSIFRKKQESPEVTLDIYAIFPIYQMLQNAAPFNDWQSPESKIPQEFIETFKVCVWMYQMYVFYILTAQRYGYDIADKVLRIQVAKLGSASPELGEQIEKGVLQIHRNLMRQANEPTIVEIKGKKLEMPAEYFLALEFLTLGEGALFHIDKAEFEAGQLPDYKGADFALAECLAHGKDSARSNFEPLIQVSKVIL